MKVVETDNLDELSEDLSEKQKAEAVNMSVEEDRAQVTAEKKRQRLEEVGL